MQYIRFRNWDKYQHYKKRRPTWIKLYASLLRSQSFMSLTESTRWHAVGLLLVASQHDNMIPMDLPWIRAEIRAKAPIDFTALIDSGMLELCEQDAIPEKSKRREETHTEEKATARVGVGEKTKPKPKGWATLAVTNGVAADWIATVQPVVQALVPPTRRSLDHLRTWHKATARRWPVEIAAQAVRDFYGQWDGEKGPPKPGAFRKWLKDLRPRIETDGYRWRDGKTLRLGARGPDGKKEMLGEWSPAKQ